MPLTETIIPTDINGEINAFYDWMTAHTGSLNAQATVAPALANEANKLSILTGSLLKLFSDTTVIVANKLVACSQDPRTLLEPVFNSVVPPLTGTV